MRRHPIALLLLAFLLLAGCSEAPPPVAEVREPESPPEPVTGRWAFHQMYGVARGWAPDIQALHLRSIHLPEVPAEPGKAGAWEAGFVSPSRGLARIYTYSVIDAPGNLRKGVFASSDQAYTGPRGQTKPFLIVALRTDTDEVYKTALKHAAAYAKKHPDMPISFVLELIPRFANPTWRVIWGESIAISDISIYVDASTGQYLQTMR